MTAQPLARRNATIAALGRRRTARGVTLVESLTCIGVIAVALGSSLPGLEQAVQRRHLEGQAAQLATDLHLARSTAVMQATNLRFTVLRNGAAACYVVHAGPADACSCGPDAQVSCSGGAQALRAAAFPADGAVRLTATSSSMVFDAQRGTVSPTGTVRLALADGTAVHHVVNIMGRVRRCSPTGSPGPLPAC